MSETWECTVCRAQATIDQDAQPLRYDCFSPVEAGPYAVRQPNPHHCPIRNEPIPPAIQDAPNARRVR